MQKIRERLPALPEILSVLSLGLLIAYSWTLFRAFFNLNAWLLIFTPAELIGIFAYLMTLALLDAVLAVAAAVLLGLFLPRRWWAQDFVARGSVAVIALWATSILLNLIGQNLLLVSDVIFYRTLITLLLFEFSLFILLRIQPYRMFICRLAERSRIFLYIYLPLGALGIILLVIRNS